MAKTVLVVDDDPDFLEQMRVQLQAAGFEVVTAENVEDAKTWLSENKPALVVVDLMMQHFDDGFALAHHIKRIDAAVPVVMVTGVTRETGMSFDASTREERAWIKADAVLNKPVRFEQLQREIKRLLNE